MFDEGHWLCSQAAVRYMGGVLALQHRQLAQLAHVFQGMHHRNYYYLQVFQNDLAI